MGRILESPARSTKSPSIFLQRFFFDARNLAKYFSSLPLQRYLIIHPRSKAFSSHPPPPPSSSLFQHFTCAFQRRIALFYSQEQCTFSIFTLPIFPSALSSLPPCLLFKSRSSALCCAHQRPPYHFQRSSVADSILQFANHMGFPRIWART